MACKFSKQGYSDIVLGLWLEFTSRSLRAGLQFYSVAVMICENLVNTQTDTCWGPLSELRDWRSSKEDIEKASTAAKHKVIGYRLAA